MKINIHICKTVLNYTQSELQNHRKFQFVKLTNVYFLQQKSNTDMLSKCTCVNITERGCMKSQNWNKRNGVLKHERKDL